MEFRTRLVVDPAHFQLSYADRMMVVGSCFAEYAGLSLKGRGFRALVNPFGVLYNPATISVNLRRLSEGVTFREDELFAHEGYYHSFYHHGSFSGVDKTATLNQINTSFLEAASAWREITTLLITFGTAWIYEWTENGQIVANCHRFPASCFHRRRLSIEEIVSVYTAFFEALFEDKPDLKLIISVSPIRHLKDGFHENTLSKSVLHLAIDALCRKFPQVVYFPAYEWLNDELRDYRFYAEDMVHPSSLAQEYIWEQFGAMFFSKRTKELSKQVVQLRKAMEHRPFHPEEEAYQRFVRKNLATVEYLESQDPGIDLSEIRTFFEGVLLNKQGDL
jgi:hypothetical protein